MASYTVKRSQNGAGYVWTVFSENGDKVKTGFAFEEYIADMDARHYIEARGEAAIDNIGLQAVPLFCPYCGFENADTDFCVGCGKKIGAIMSKKARYIIQDTYGAPQSGLDEIEFDEWYELDEYLDEHPDVAERIEQGYAAVIEAGRKADREMKKDMILQTLQGEIDKFNSEWLADMPAGMKVDYSAEKEVLPDGVSYLIEVVDFSETLSEIYYEFEDTYYSIIGRFEEAVRKDTGDQWFYLEPYSSRSGLNGRAWPSKGASRKVAWVDESTEINGIRFRLNGPTPGGDGSIFAVEFQRGMDSWFEKDICYVRIEEWGDNSAISDLFAADNYALEALESRNASTLKQLWSWIQDVLYTNGFINTKRASRKKAARQPLDVSYDDGYPTDVDIAVAGGSFEVTNGSYIIGELDLQDIDDVDDIVDFIYDTCGDNDIVINETADSLVGKVKDTLADDGFTVARSVRMPLRKKAAWEESEGVWSFDGGSGYVAEIWPRGALGEGPGLTVMVLDSADNAVAVDGNGDWSLDDAKAVAEQMLERELKGASRKLADLSQVEISEFVLNGETAYEGSLCDGRYWFEIYPVDDGNWETRVTCDDPRDDEFAFGYGITVERSLQDAVDEMKDKGVVVTAARKVADADGRLAKVVIASGRSADGEDVEWCATFSPFDDVNYSIWVNGSRWHSEKMNGFEADRLFEEVCEMGSEAVAREHGASRKVADEFYEGYIVDTPQGEKPAFIQDEDGVFLWCVDAEDGSLLDFDGYGKDTLEDAVKALGEKYEIVRYASVKRSKKADRGDKLQALYSDYVTENPSLSDVEKNAIGDFLDWLYATGRKASRKAAVNVNDLMLEFAAWYESEYGYGPEWNQTAAMAFVWLADNGHLASRKAAYGNFGIYDLLGQNGEVVIETPSGSWFYVYDAGGIEEITENEAREYYDIDVLRSHYRVASRKTAFPASFDDFKYDDYWGVYYYEDEQVTVELSKRNDDSWLVDVVWPDGASVTNVQLGDDCATVEDAIAWAKKTFESPTRGASRKTAAKWRMKKKEGAWDPTIMTARISGHTVYIKFRNGDAVLWLKDGNGSYRWQSWCPDSEYEYVFAEWCVDVEDTIENLISQIDRNGDCHGNMAWRKTSSRKTAMTDEDFATMVDDAYAGAQDFIEEGHADYSDVESEVYSYIQSWCDNMGGTISSDEEDEAVRIVMDELENDGLV